MSKKLNEISKIDLSRGSTVYTKEDVFKVKRRVIEEDESGATIMVVVLQDIESHRLFEKMMEEDTRYINKIQKIEQVHIDNELDNLKGDYNDPSVDNIG